MKKLLKYFPSIFILILAISNASFGQTTDSLNNGYYISYPNQVMARLYLSQKYAPFTISSDNDINELKYKTNSKLSLGAGFSYRSLTVNLSYGFNFLNKEKGKGKTKGLDFQFHLYPHKWAIDLLGSFRKGYYLEPRKGNGLNLSTYYNRPDVKRHVIGFAVYRVPNASKFSYRAALAQNDWQTKSAGSLLYGAELYYGTMKGDSALVPNKVAGLFLQSGITRANFISIGPGVGYAYTLVIDKNFFITGSAIGNLDVNFSNETKGSNQNKNFTIIPDAIYKGAIGYNSSTWSITASIIGNALYSGSEASKKEYFLPTGTARLVFAKRLNMK